MHTRIEPLTTRWLLVVAATLTAIWGVACGSGPAGTPAAPAGVDASEGSVSMTVGGRHGGPEPLVCPGHRVITGTVPGPGISPGDGYSVTATLTGGTVATLTVDQGRYKSSSTTYRGTAAVSLVAASGPAGSLTGSVTDGQTSLSVSATFTCSARGGGIYAGDTDVTNGPLGTPGPGFDVYLAVTHDGTRVRALQVAADQLVSGRLPNVELRADDVAVRSGGSFAVTVPLIANDPSGVPFRGLAATVRGVLDGEGGASGTLTMPAKLRSSPLLWQASINNGPTSRPEFPHADPASPIVSADAVADDPAMALIYPGSTDVDGSTPGRPIARSERPQLAYASMDPHWGLSSPAGSIPADPAEALREQATGAGMYGVATWYTTHLTAMGWKTATSAGRHTDAVVFFHGPDKRLELQIVAPPSRGPGAPSQYAYGVLNTTFYRLTLDAVTAHAQPLDRGFTLGPPERPIIPCLVGAPATITVSGTVTGTAGNTCLDQTPTPSQRSTGVPSCRPPTGVRFAVGDVKMTLWLWNAPNPAELDITGPHLMDEARLVATSSPAVTSADGTLRVSGAFVWHGLPGQVVSETLDVSVACSTA